MSTIGLDCWELLNEPLPVFRNCFRSLKALQQPSFHGLSRASVLPIKSINADSRMRTFCLLIALLSSATIGLAEVKKTPNSPGWKDFPSVLAAKRVTVTVVSIPGESALSSMSATRSPVFIGLRTDVDLNEGAIAETLFLC